MKIASGRKPGSDFRFNQIQESQDSHPLHKKTYRNTIQQIRQDAVNIYLLNLPQKV